MQAMKQECTVHAASLMGGGARSTPGRSLIKEGIAWH